MKANALAAVMERHGFKVGKVYKDVKRVSKTKPNHLGVISYRNYTYKRLCHDLNKDLLTKFLKYLKALPVEGKRKGSNINGRVNQIKAIEELIKEHDEKSNSTGT